MQSAIKVFENDGCGSMFCVTRRSAWVVAKRGDLEPERHQFGFLHSWLNHSISLCIMVIVIFLTDGETALNNTSDILSLRKSHGE